MTHYHWPHPFLMNCQTKKELGSASLYAAKAYTYSITLSLFHSRLKTFLFCKSFTPQPFLFFPRTDYMDSPNCLLLLLSISTFLVFSLSVLHYLVVGSVR